MRIVILGLAVLASACLARDFGECINGTERKGNHCVVEDPVSPNDASADASTGESDPDSGLDPNASDAQIDGGSGDSYTCSGPTECGSDAPVCNEEKCSACDQDNDCARFANIALPACGPDGSCVECTANEQCLNPEKPICGADNRCEGPCASDQDCARSSASAWATPYCELGTGVCVGCIPGALEIEQCQDPVPGDGVNAPACDPATNTCTGRPRQSVHTCGACTSDSECADADHRCVPTEFQGQPAGSFCLPIVSSACSSPLSEIHTGSSALGLVDSYCFPDAQRATCEAILDRANECETDTDCGVADVDDGLCIGTINKKCSYRCNGNDDCEGVSCSGPLGARYCDPN